MEFISENEVYEVLREFGIERVPVKDDRVELAFEERVSSLSTSSLRLSICSWEDRSMSANRTFSLSR